MAVRLPILDFWTDLYVSTNCTSQVVMSLGLGLTPRGKKIEMSSRLGTHDLGCGASVTDVGVSMSLPEQPFVPMIDFRREK